MAPAPPVVLVEVFLSLARDVERYLLRQPEVASVNLNVVNGHPRVFYLTIQAAFHPDQAQALMQLRLGIVGLLVGELRTDDGGEYPIVVGMGTPEDVDVFDRIAVPNVAGQPVLVSQVTEVGLAEGPPQIRYYNKQRFASVSAFAKTGYNVFALFDEIRPQLAEIDLPAGYWIDEAGEAGSSAESAGGIGLSEAVLDGAETRVLPILLTAATAIGGLTPLALEENSSVSPLGYVLIGGW